MTTSLHAVPFEKSKAGAPDFRPRSAYLAFSGVGQGVGNTYPKKLVVDRAELGLREIQSDDLELYHAEDNVFVKQIKVSQAGHMVPGHGHKFDHLSMLSVGSVVMYAKDADATEYDFVGEFHAPCGINVPAEKHHLFIALADNTILYCIHNTHNLEKHEVKEGLVASEHEVMMHKLEAGHEQMKGDQ